MTKERDSRHNKTVWHNTVKATHGKYAILYNSIQEEVRGGRGMYRCRANIKWVNMAEREGNEPLALIPSHGGDP